MAINFSRWLKENELKELRDVKEINYNEDIEVSGIPLAVDGKKMLIDSGVASSLIIGATGSGKTQSTVLPMLNLIAKAGESAIVNDPNGELYTSTAEIFKSRGYEVVALNFKDPRLGDCWNPLEYPYYLYKNNRKDEAIKLIEDLARILLHEKSTVDPFWENAASNYFTSLCLSLFKDGKEEEINLNSIGLMITQGEEKYHISTYAKTYFEGMEKSDIAYINASTTICAPKETRGSIISVLRQKLSVYLSREALSEMMSSTSFDLNNLRDKHIVYLILPEHQTSVYPLVTAFIEQTHYVVSNASGKKFNYILDDFDNLPAMNNFDMMINFSRSKNINFILVIRNYRNLRDNYGKDVAEKIISSCANVFYLLTDDRATAEVISEQCGLTSKNERLITTDELLRMNQWETVFLKVRSYPIKIKLTPNYKIDWNEEVQPATLTTRERKQIKTFNIQELVRQKYPPINVDELIEKIDLKIAELDKEDEKLNQKEDNKTVIEKPIKKIEIEKDKITIYYE